ncbi:MAG TPA: acetyltransferase [Phycisphaerae bacterium]|nr:acetyltransferase [Phycisphaerae bacterium]
MTNEQSFQEWCVVELMGHQRIAGYVTEQTIAGANLLRVDVPAGAGEPPMTRFFGPAAIYSITPVTENVARRAAAYLIRPPVQRWELPAPDRDAAEVAAEDDADEADGFPADNWDGG